MRVSAAAAVVPLVGLATATSLRVPSVDVPACPRRGTIKYSKSVPDLTDFPRTQVDLCYTDTSISLTFTALDETNFYFNASQGTNDDIWEYEVMEAFIYKGTEDPQTYLEFEINPNNVTYQAFVYNPSKDRADGAPFDHFFVSDPATDGFSATTKLDKRAKSWTSRTLIPLALFNVDNGRAKGTNWRMNFFRTITSPSTYPDQQLGAWSPPNKASFHISKYFGHVRFV
ncbi:hypothetical protein BGZ63DRAFT_392010 [Mariannaea sp. PMI_226]|nr:hypothetical protein BGZ63DRAFT_392010 [Mariannaea sp. PMI_226]